ncbi:heme exporter protein CcmD [Salmonella enterica subsp. enterica serovar Virchow]|nr:heme exporter protein CcmD [Salmonella enterica subsp. enterica serovar Virchow]
MSPHFWYVASAYGVSALVLGGLTLWLIVDAAARKRELAVLEASGLRRRSDRRSEQADESKP